MTSIRTAIIGVTGFGNAHYRDLMREVEAGRMEPVAATIINQDEVPEKCEALRSHGCEIFDDYREMLDRCKGRIELCMIPTGIHLHAPMTIDALEAGCNVFVEKPAAATYADVQAMKAAERKSGRFVAVGFQAIYAEETLMAKRAILEGRIGKVLSIATYAHWPRSDSYYGRNRWAGRLEVDGVKVMDSPFNNALSHNLNLQCFFVGQEEHTSTNPLSVQAELYRAREIQSCDTACLHMETAPGAELHFHVTHACKQRSGVITRITGENGRLEYQLGTPTRIMLNDGSRDVLEPTGLHHRHALMNRLIAKCQDPSSFVCTLDIAGAQTLSANVAHESCPIQTLESQYTERIEPSGDEEGRVVIPDIEEDIRRASDEKKSFSELGLPWATARGKRVLVSESEAIREARAIAD